MWNRGGGRPGDLAVFGALALTTVLTRLPFLSASSVGLDPDAARVALTARHLATAGEYVASRFPGYPLHEVGSALGWFGGPLALNGMTALWSGVAAGFFGLVLRRVGVRAYALGALAFALTPVVFVNSVVAMDYLWSLAFVLAGLYFVVTAKSVIAGMNIELATAARLTAPRPGTCSRWLRTGLVSCVSTTARSHFPSPFTGRPSECGGR